MQKKINIKKLKYEKLALPVVYRRLYRLFSTPSLVDCPLNLFIYTEGNMRTDIISISATPFNKLIDLRKGIAYTEYIKIESLI